MIFDKTQTVKEMKKYAEDELGVTIASNITSREVVIGKIEEVIAFKEKEYADGAKKVKSQKPFGDEEKVKIKFNYLNSPGCALTFNYEGFDAVLQDGREYDLPKSVMKHLNTRVQPIYEAVEEEGQACRVVGERNRFACIPQ